MLFCGLFIYLEIRYRKLHVENNNYLNVKYTKFVDFKSHFLFTSLGAKKTEL